MAVEHYLQIPRAKDCDLIAFFRQVATILGSDVIAIRQFGSAKGVQIPLASEDLPFEPYASSNAYLIQSITTTINKFSVSLSRDSDSQSFIFDRIKTHNGQYDHQQVANPFGEDTIYKVNNIANSIFLNSIESSALLYSDPDTYRELLASHQRMIERMQESVVSVGEQVASERIRLEKEAAQRLTVLETEFEKRKTLAEQALDDVRQALERREEQLQTRAKELDDRDHIHARRELREQITSGIATRLRSSMVPAQTSFIGWGVFFLTLVGTVFLAVTSVYSLQEFSQLLKSAIQSAGSKMESPEDKLAIARVQSSQAWVVLARAAVTGIGAVAFLVYAIAWLKNIYHDRLRAHRDLERYSIDLNRASWAVETIMEAKHDGSTIPDILVAGVSRNLFGEGDKSSDGHGSEALGSLLRASTRAKIGPTGAEFEMTSRGARKLADEIDS
ncbi:MULTISPECIES: hypothetical protein [unclassified Mesorhizobium]|uniref:hypothetical protein n=1 Tax=unclassified Mesorhizobium TaxID=325217 RepID=UPI00112E69A6|nr:MULTISPECIES: hypothetical protein [unclassified Mesorhizobium]TPK67112.1 hypothetical protein FJ551_04875 [Mesorhizobium sp. B2-5-1]TPM61708.1 hypothetical protein FJ962_12210 [Mesorhizobium sp. B2-1-9]TPM86080.1 hypothetical protein FJ963_11830 [Mesorhizobium sp. B2-1-4]TPN13423.1 hypothetical protein FJ971_04780 [Mesorhizobium sp. B2-1-2]UCI10977.1 hypothetical protein FJ972_15100 [Mesorhizobium sp. B2-1-1]